LFEWPLSTKKSNVIMDDPYAIRACTDGLEQGWPKCGPPKIFCGPCVKFWMRN